MYALPPLSQADLLDGIQYLTLESLQCENLALPEKLRIHAIHYERKVPLLPTLPQLSDSSQLNVAHLIFTYSLSVRPFPTPLKFAC